MAITLVDINELASTISKNKDMLFVVEVPSGSGYIQAKITKEQMFKLVAQNLDMTTTEDLGGANDVITFDGAGGNKIVYVNDGTNGKMVFKVGQLGVSADGITNVILMSPNGTFTIGAGAIDGRLRIKDGQQFYPYTGKDLMQDVIVDLDILDGETTVAKPCRQSIAYLEVDSDGTIAAHTIQFPANAKIGYTFELSVRGTITALSLTDGLSTIDEPLTTVTNGGGKWVRVINIPGVGEVSWRRLR